MHGERFIKALPIIGNAMGQRPEVPLFGLARLLEVIEEFESRKGRDPYTVSCLVTCVCGGVMVRTYYSWLGI